MDSETNGLTAYIYLNWSVFLSFCSAGFRTGIVGANTFLGIPPRVKSLGPFKEGNLQLKQNEYCGTLNSYQWHQHSFIHVNKTKDSREY